MSNNTTPRIENKAPVIDPCPPAIALKTRAFAKPDCNDTTMPAVSKEDIRIRITVPINSPTSISDIINKANGKTAFGGDGKLDDSTGVITKQIAKTNNNLILVGTKLSPTLGINIIALPILQNSSKKANKLSAIKISNCITLKNGIPLKKNYPIEIILSAINSINACKAIAIAGNKINIERKIAIILGTKERVISCICVSACINAITTPTTKPISMTGEANFIVSHIASRIKSITSACSIKSSIS